MLLDKLWNLVPNDKSKRCIVKMKIIDYEIQM